jgi:hypothetical protein
MPGNLSPKLTIDPKAAGTDCFQDTKLAADRLPNWDKHPKKEQTRLVKQASFFPFMSGHS